MRDSDISILMQRNRGFGGGDGGNGGNGDGGGCTRQDGL